MSNENQPTSSPPSDKNSETGVEVQVIESTERWSEFQLEDGTRLRLKMLVGAFRRLDDQFDPAGNPVYALQGAPVCHIVSVPDSLKKKEK